jgi:hypothetical protein
MIGLVELGMPSTQGTISTRSEEASLRLSIWPILV